MESYNEIYFEEEYLNEDTICSICQAEFLDLEDLEIHTKQVHSIEEKSETHDYLLKKCDFCSYCYTDLQNYAFHLRDKHILKLEYCRFCLRAFDDISCRQTHEGKHICTYSVTELKCSLCEHKSDIPALREHDKTHRQEVEGVFIQHLLPFLSVALHVKATTVLESICTGKTEMRCIGCNYMTSNLKLLIKHAKTSKCECFVCSNCSNVYKNRANLKRHLTKLCLKPYQNKICPDCDKPFNDGYSNHKKVCKVVECNTCGEKFDNIDLLTQHQSKEHPVSIELETCKFCWKQCFGRRTLQRHVDKVHKPYFHLYKYQCVYCKNVYKHPEKLFGHFFRSHRDIYPYNCKICNITFRVRKRFTLHIKLIHKSEGFVEFDENYHVFFDLNKSENPFIPKSIYTNEDVYNTSKTDIQSEAETNQQPKLKRKRTTRKRKSANNVYSSDDEPLSVVKRRTLQAMSKSLNKPKIKLKKIDKSHLTCKVCNEYCYTVQNYNHHKSLHSSHEAKKCIKCSKVFRSKEKLKNHIEVEHSTSKLTETLKTIIAKRKLTTNLSEKELKSERIRRTIKKTTSTYAPVTVKITRTQNRLSAKNFIENFTPEIDSKQPEVSDNLKISVVTKKRKPFIKLTKFKPDPVLPNTKLAMPVKFKSFFDENVDISVKVIKKPIVTEVESDNNFDDRNDYIPDVAEEIETVTEEIGNPQDVQHQFIIPNAAGDLKHLQIAHLQPQAPYFKIIKVTEFLDSCNTQENNPEELEELELPDGTKLVNTNPLAHLLKDVSMEEVLKNTKNKYYKPKIQTVSKNFQEIFAEALSKLEIPTVRKRKTTKNETFSEIELLHSEIDIDQNSQTESFSEIDIEQSEKNESFFEIDLEQKDCECTKAESFSEIIQQSKKNESFSEIDIELSTKAESFSELIEQSEKNESFSEIDIKQSTKAESFSEVFTEQSKRNQSYSAIDIKQSVKPESLSEIFMKQSKNNKSFPEIDIEQNTNTDSFSEFDTEQSKKNDSLSDIDIEQCTNESQQSSRNSYGTQNWDVAKNLLEDVYEYEEHLDEELEEDITDLKFDYS